MIAIIEFSIFVVSHTMAAANVGNANLHNLRAHKKKWPDLHNKNTTEILIIEYNEGRKIF